MTGTDVRMMGFQRRTPVARVWQWIDEHCQPLESEEVGFRTAAGRVLADDVVSQVNVPQFRRSMMDGFAVQTEDISGASEGNPTALRLVGEAWPGKPTSVSVTSGTAVQVMTGAPLPSGADVVVPVEMAERQDSTIRVAGALPCGKHVGDIGEDIQQGATVLNSGRRLRPQDLGVLSSIGCSVVPVVRRPQVRICLTGNELLPAGSSPRDFHITDANSPLLEPLIERDGGEAVFTGITRDEPDAILEVLSLPADLVLISGGSSVGHEDYAPLLLREHGQLAIHGVAMRPSSPAGVGFFGDKPVFLLPGNPVSCLCAYDFFAGRAIRRMAGRSADWPYRSIRAPLRRDLASQLGRLDYARVRLVDSEVEPIAISGASVLSSTTSAEGFVLIGENLEGLAAGSEVEVFLYEPA